MNRERTLIALAAVIVGGAILSRKAEAADFGGDVLQEIKVTAQRIGEGGGLMAFFGDAVPLGLRNNNPMNVRETAIQWLGELPHDGDGYEDFDSAANGIRAGCRLLINYNRLHSINTVRGIITRWAPAADNNPTAAYIDFVSKRLAEHPDQQLNMGSIETITNLADAIIAFENGAQPFTKSFLRDQAKRAL